MVRICPDARRRTSRRRSILARRRLSSHRAIQTTFLGLVVAAVGAIGLVQLLPIDGLPAHRPGIRQWYPLILLIIGASIILASMILGGLRQRALAT